MSHTADQALHGYQKRALDVRVEIATAEDHSDFSGIIFRVADVEKTSLTPEDSSSGFYVDLTLTAGDLDFDAGTYRWELVGEFGGELRSLAQGPFTLDPEPTEAS